MSVGNFFRKQRVFRPSRPRRHEDEDVVQQGLAVTPAQMLELTERGVPVTPANLGLQYDEGYDKLDDFDVPMQYRRGVDIGELWEERHTVKDKFGKRIQEMRADGTLNPSQE